MAEVEEPNLMTFVSDIHYLLCGIGGVGQFIFGLSYLFGKTIFEWTSFILVGIWSSFYVAAEVLKELFAGTITKLFKITLLLYLLYYYYAVCSIFS